jgi:hypothetical protein
VKAVKLTQSELQAHKKIDFLEMEEALFKGGSREFEIKIE